jgi:hypothetical protein
MVRLGDRGEAPRGRASNALSAIGLRFERSRVGEVLISGLVVVAILIGVVWNLPESQIKQTMMPTLRPIAAATGLQQAWRMYAPEPVSALETIEVRVTMADGPDRVWTLSRGDRVIGPFAWYRWQKLKEQTIREPNSRAGIAHWALRELTTSAERPVRVQMLFRSQPLPAPGINALTPVTEQTLYDETLTGQP